MDFAPAMLEIAREKAPGLTFEEGDALALRYPDGAFDAVTVGFGARNFGDLDRGLREMARVAKPGGRVVVLEITTPQKPPLSWFFRAWFDTVVPALGRVAGDPDAYTYLPEQRAALPGPGGAGGADGRRRAGGRALGAHGGRDHRHPRGDAAVNTAQAQLGAVLSAGGPALARLLERTETRLAEVAEGHGAELGAHAGGTLAAGGKRLRPVLVFLCGGRATRGGRRRALVAAGAAVELLHMATLVHDDVLDAAELRRGRPTVFAEAGRPAATATGDLLFSRAFAELAATGSEDAVRALSTASSALARGELMQRADAWDENVTPERYLERCRLKTASLFEASCRLGALFGGRPDLAAALGQLRRAGRPGVPDARRRARRLRPAGAHRQAARRRPARRHRDAAADPGAPRGPDAARLGDHGRRGGRGVRPHRGDRRARRGAHAGARPRGRGEGGLGRLELSEERLHALSLVADGVVERYA